MQHYFPCLHFQNVKYILPLPKEYKVQILCGLSYISLLVKKNAIKLKLCIFTMFSFFPLFI